MPNNVLYKIYEALLKIADNVGYGEITSDQDAQGWTIPITGTLVRDSADDPIYILKVVGKDIRNTISNGMRIKWTQDGSTRYGLIHGVELSGSDTLVTIYGGTDYDMEDTGTYAISDCYASPMKAPFGFKNTADLWSELITDDSNHTENSVSRDTWYNTGSISIDIPIGKWDLSYRCPVAPTGFTDFNVQFTTLSTSTSSQNDRRLSSYTGRGGSDNDYGGNILTKYPLTLTTKTTYYLLQSNRFDDGGDLRINGADYFITEIRATSAYL